MKIFFSFILLLGSFWVSAQSTSFTDKEASNKPIYRKLIKANGTFSDIQRAFKLYEAKHPGKYKQYHRWEYRAEMQLNSNGKLPSSQEVERAFRAFHKNNVQSRSVTSNWTSNGPISLPVNETGQPNGVGRVNEIAFEPGNANTIYIGTPAAGLWKSTDGGSTWASYTDNLPTLGISAIVVDKDNHDVIFIGTGDRDSFDSNGKGVMKSTDGGVTFVSINNGISNNEYINDLIQDPTDGNVLIAAGEYNGIHRSTDGGDTWTNMYPYESIVNIVFKPGDADIVYASSDSGRFFKSVNNGQSWTLISAGIPTTTPGRAFIAVSPATPNDVYFVRANNRYFEGLYHSTDSGENFTLKSSTPNIFGYYSGTGNDEFRGQGWYDLTIVADPINANVIYVGSVNIWKSTDSGANWVKKTSWAGLNSDAVHADQHHLTFAPNGYCYAANDGGVYYSTDGWTTNTEISSGLAISQLYKIGQSKQSQNLVIAGFQDNGTGLLSGNTWATVVGGDGMECAIDPTDDAYQYTELYYGTLRRSINDSYFYSIENINEDAPWVTPFVIHPTDPNMMLMGRNKHVWRSTNIKTPNSGDVTWTSISDAFTKPGTGFAISEVDGKTTYYSTKNRLYRCDDVTAANPVWISLTQPTPTSNINDIITHPTDINILYIASGSGIYKSNDKGATWTNYTYNFPSLQILCLAYDKNTNEGLYAGSTAGIYYLEPGTNNWTSFNQNFPINVDARELEIYYDDVTPANNLIRVATYGRGMWSSPLAASPLPVSLVAFAGKKISHHAVALNWQTSSEINNDYFSIQRSTDGTHFETLGTVKGAGNTTSINRYSLIDKNPKEGVNYYQLVQHDNDGVKHFHNIIAISFSVDNYRGVEVFPNPTDGLTTVYINKQYEGKFDISIFNQLGQVVFTKSQAPNGRHELDLSNLQKGTYFLEIKNEAVLNTQKIILR